MDRTNLEIGYYQNKKPDSMIYLSKILDSYFGMDSYKIEEEIDGIYNAVLNSSILFY